MCKLGRLKAWAGATQVLGSFSHSISEQRFINRRKPPPGSRLTDHKPLPQLHNHLPVHLNLMDFVYKECRVGLGCVESRWRCLLV